MKERYTLLHAYCTNMPIIGRGVKKEGNVFEGGELDFIMIIMDCFSQFMVETDSSNGDQVTYYKKHETNDWHYYS